MTHYDHQQLSLYLDGELPPAESVAVRQHVAACDVCGAELQSLHEVDHVLARFGTRQLPLPHATNARVHRSWQRRRSLGPLFALTRMMPAAVGTTAAALLLLASANLSASLRPQTAAAPIPDTRNARLLARQSQPLLLVRRSSAVLGTHVIATTSLPRMKLLFSES